MWREVSVGGKVSVGGGECGWREVSMEGGECGWREVSVEGGECGWRGECGGR